MDSLKQRFIALLMATVPSLVGCASLWEEVPSPATSNPQVRLDAAWFLDSPSPDVVKRVQQERQEHIEKTLRQRSEGKVSVSLQEMLQGTAEGTGAVETQPTSPDLPDSPVPELAGPASDGPLVHAHRSTWNALIGGQAGEGHTDGKPSRTVTTNRSKIVIQLADGTEFSR